MNRIELEGNLAVKPELHSTPNGRAVCTLRVATSRTVNDAKFTDFHDVEVWREAAEEAAKHAKGTRVRIVGRLTYDQWTAEDGSKRSRAKVIGYRVSFPTWEASVASEAEAAGVE